MEPAGGFGIDPAAIVSAFATATNDITTLMASLLPYGLGIFVTIWGVRKAIQFFKGTTASN